RERRVGRSRGELGPGELQAALRGAPGSEDRSRLIGSLVQEYFRSYQEVARGSQERPTGPTPSS
ncbi:MAG: hypothetical protein ACRD21_16325, partial [Vicinamibacteria bacterium]